MTAQRSAVLRTPVDAQATPEAAVSKVPAEPQIRPLRPAELPLPTFPPQFMKANSPGLRPKKIAIEFETARSSKRGPLLVAAAGSVVLAFGALLVTLRLPDLSGTLSVLQPFVNQPQSIPTGAEASLSEERVSPTLGASLMTPAHGGPSETPAPSVPELGAGARNIPERPLPATEQADQGSGLQAAIEAPSALQSPPFDPGSPKTAAPASDHGQFPATLAVAEVPPPAQRPGAATRVAALGAIKVVAAPHESSGHDSQGERLMKRALDMIQQGDISGARLILERAVSSGSAQAAFHLAQTYDPRILAKWQARGIKGDPTRSRELYRMAAQAGVPEAQEHIANLE
jgi:hypothetical protein